MWGSSFDDRGLRIEKQSFHVKLFLFSQRTTLYSHVAVQILHRRSALAVWCNFLNFQLRQAFNKCKSIFSVLKIYPACVMYVAFVCNIPRFSQMNGVGWQFYELNLSRFWANHDEDYNIWVVKFAISQASTSFSCKCILEHSAFHSLSSFKNSAILWHVTHLAYVKMLIKSRETMFVLKSEIFMCALVNYAACHTVTVCKICKSTCSHTIISQKILFTQKARFSRAFKLLNFPLVNFTYVTFHSPCSFENTTQRLHEL